MRPHSKGLFPQVFKDRMFSQEPHVVVLASILLIFQETWVLECQFQALFLRITNGANDIHPHGFMRSGRVGEKNRELRIPL